MHPRDGCDDSSSTEEHVGTGEDVVDETENHEDGVGDFSYTNNNQQLHQMYHDTSGLPYRIRTSSREVCASGIFLLQEIPRRAKKTIMGLHPAANQKGPDTP